MSTPRNDVVEPSGMLEKPQTYPKWVGLVFALFLPGAAHFLAGKRRTGILLLLSWPVWLYSVLFFFTLPGISGVMPPATLLLPDFLLAG